MYQLKLFPNENKLAMFPVVRNEFSHANLTAESERLELERVYGSLLYETDRFSRQLVSFQANKTEILHRWIKYREGFSAALVQLLLDEFGIRPGHRVLDPFAGSGTTLLVSMLLGIDATGIELLPHCHVAWDAKRRVFDYDMAELEQLVAWLRTTTPEASSRLFPHLAITESAFPPDIEAELMAYSEWVLTHPMSEDARVLSRFVLMSILEEISYTRKDGQYLRWDGRARKIVDRNRQRRKKGAPLIKGINKGDLPRVSETFIAAFQHVMSDVIQLQADQPPKSCQEMIPGNALKVLPILEADLFDAVVTSPPYANRYDYTRTYALELAYLGVADGIFALRQQMLSCTVENRSKLDELSDQYSEIGQSARFEHISAVIHQNAALREVNEALRYRAELGEMNNRGVLTMIDQYFTELGFIFAELHRVCRTGARVIFVNDNVRYAGEVIPVDLLSTDLAAAMGFVPEIVYVLPQRKGNSSQQMGRYGRVALRKSITVWRKE